MVRIPSPAPNQAYEKTPPCKPKNSLTNVGLQATEPKRRLRESPIVKVVVTNARIEGHLMKAKAAVAGVFVVQLLASTAQAMPLQKVEASIAPELVSGGCGSLAFRTPWGACMTYREYRRRGDAPSSDNGGWGRPAWQSGDAGYHSLRAGWRGGGYYGPE